MPPQLISLEAVNYLLMHLLGSQRACGLLFLIRRDSQFALLPYFPRQGVRPPETELHAYPELVGTIFGLLGEGWEVVGRVQLDYQAVRAGKSFWTETAAILSEIDEATQEEPAAARQTCAAPPR